MVPDITPTDIITIAMSKVSGCVPIPWGAIDGANHPKETKLTTAAKIRDIHYGFTSAGLFMSQQDLQ